MKQNTKIIIIITVLVIIASLIFIDYTQNQKIAPYEMIGNNSLGTVERIVYGNENATFTISIITGIHPREKLAIGPEIKSAKEYGQAHDNVRIVHYQVNVTQDPQDYEKGRANGESLVHDFVNKDIGKTHSKAVIISHSHMEGYGEGFYLATPEMDNPSVSIAEKISKNSDFNYYPRTGNESYKSTSAVLVSKPIAQAGNPTFVYEIPENITKADSTNKTYELFDLMVKYA